LRKTVSGNKEKDLSKRFCHLHLPGRVEKALRHMNDALMLVAPCRSGRGKRVCYGRKVSSDESCLGLPCFPCLIPLDLDDLPNPRQLCFDKHTRLERGVLIASLRWARYCFRGQENGKCTYLPHIKWHKKRVPFVFGVSRAPF